MALNALLLFIGFGIIICLILHKKEIMSIITKTTFLEKAAESLTSNDWYVGIYPDMLGDDVYMLLCDNGSFRVEVLEDSRLVIKHTWLKGKRDPEPNQIMIPVEDIEVELEGVTADPDIEQYRIGETGFAKMNVFGSLMLTIDMNLLEELTDDIKSQKDCLLISHV